MLNIVAVIASTSSEVGAVAVKKFRYRHTWKPHARILKRCSSMRSGHITGDKGRTGRKVNGKEKVYQQEDAV